MLGVFHNTLTANDNYPVEDCGNLWSPIQMYCPLKSRNFSNFFVLFLESTSSFKHFEKKDDLHSLFISEIRDCERVV